MIKVINGEKINCAGFKERFYKKLGEKAYRLYKWALSKREQLFMERFDLD